MQLRKIGVLICIVLSHFGLQGQNLVPNPSFEELKDTITKFTDDNSRFDQVMSSWKSANKASPDVISPDFYERYITPGAAHSGKVMAGIQADLDYTEYIGVSLLEPMHPNRSYLIEYWIKRSTCLAPSKNIDQEMNDYFGIYFTQEPMAVTTKSMMVKYPHVKAESNPMITDQEWVKISNVFTPDMEYNYLYLGQFKAKSYTTHMRGYFLIDDVSVTEVTDFNALSEDVALPLGSIIPLNHVHFISGTADLKDRKKSLEILDELAQYLALHSSIRIQINGHTDSRGSKGKNRELSEKRANAIANILISKGIMEDRIESKGFGEEIPIADNDLAEGRQKNRRVEFEVIE